MLTPSFFNLILTLSSSPRTAICTNSQSENLRLYLNYLLISSRNCIYCYRGNALLIGSIGTHLNSLAALALYMLEYPIHPVDCTYPNTFLDGLRSAVRQAGCDGKTTTVLFTVSICFFSMGHRRVPENRDSYPNVLMI